MSYKMDGLASRTPADIERRYNFGKSFSEIQGLASEARNLAYEAEKIAKEVEAKVLNIDVVEALNVSSGTIDIKTEGLTIKSTDFSLSAEDGIKAIKGNFGGWDISSKSIYKHTDSSRVEILAPTTGTEENVISVATISNGNVTNIPFCLKSTGNIYTTGIIQSSNAANGNVTTISSGSIESNSANISGTITASGMYGEAKLAGGRIYFTRTNGSTGATIWFDRVYDRMQISGGDGGIEQHNTIFTDGNRCVQAGSDVYLRFADGGLTTKCVFDRDYVQGVEYFSIQPIVPMMIDAPDDMTNFFYGYWDCQGGWKFNKTVFNAGGGTAFTSDRNVKNSIEDMPDTYGVLFDNLRPIIHKFNNGTSDRYHTGYIAQEVDEAREKAGLTRQDFAAVCIEDEGLETEKWYLRYTEFIPIHTYEIQKLKKEVAALKAKLEGEANE